MKNSKGIFGLFVLLLILGVSRFCLAWQETETAHWYKGNTHTHTLNSDGDSSPEDVVRWYRENGYHFVVITDHNFLTNVDGLNAVYGAENQFIVIKGVEVSDRFGLKPIHINSLNPGALVLPQRGNSVVETIKNNVDAIREASGIPHINHPNFRWALTAGDLEQVDNCQLFELYSGHPSINNFGGGGMPSVEEMWDDLLSSGKLIYGLAVDDAHTFKEPWNRDAAKPGQAWIMVRSDRLTPSSIVEAIEQGDFYSSTGVDLEEYIADEKGLSITIKKTGTEKFCTRFIGKDGKVLKEDIQNPATYQFKGDEMYIRAKVMDSNGRIAWTQPVILQKKPSGNDR
jgi:hypothetical protein